MYPRQAHAVDSSHHILNFELGTGSSNLRNHLITNHLEEWVSSCDDLNIEISACSALPAISKYHNEPVNTSTPLESECQKYSKEAFVDALVEFIVGDDQLCVSL